MNGDEIDLSEHHLETLPNEILSLTSVHTINLRKNRLRELPLTFKAFIHLKTLHLTRNQFSSFPSVIICLPHLENLNLSSNQLRIIPALDTLKNLRELDLSNNRLESVGTLPPNLYKVNLFRNVLHEVPSSFLELPQLSLLNLSANLLEKLPSDIGTRLPRLTKLDVSHNHLTHLPLSLLNVPLLNTLVVKNNPWLCPSFQVCQRGKEAIFRELKRLEHATTSAKFSKVRLATREVVVDKPITFFIDAHDEIGACRIKGGELDTFSIEIDGLSSEYFSLLTDHENGTYSFEVRFPCLGKYSISVRCNNQMLSNCPLTVPQLKTQSLGADRRQQLDRFQPQNEEHLLQFNNALPPAAFNDYIQIQKLDREYEHSMDIPEIVILGPKDEGYIDIVECFLGYFPLSRSREAILRRPVYIHLMYNEKHLPHKPLIAIKRDKLSGLSTSGFCNDIISDGSALLDLLEERNKTTTSNPIHVMFESSQVINSLLILAPTLDDSIFESDITLHPKQEHHIIADLLAPDNRMVVWVVKARDTNDYAPFCLLSLRKLITQYDEMNKRTLHVFTDCLQLNRDNFLRNFRTISGKGNFFVPTFDHTLRDDVSDISFDEYVLRIWQNEQMSHRALLDILTLFGVQEMNEQENAYFGLLRLRKHLWRWIYNQYYDHRAFLMSAWRNQIVDCQKQLDLDSQSLELLESRDSLQYLRGTVSDYTIEFCLSIKDLFKGTIQAGYVEDLGQSLQEELDEIFTTNTKDVLDLGNEIHQEVLGILPQAEQKLYGGAQLIRTLDYFTTLVDLVTLPPFSRHTHSPAALAAHHIRQIIAPLLEQLCTHSFFVVQRCADLVENILVTREENDSDNININHLMVYSYLPKHIKELFIDTAMRAVEEFKCKCFEEFEQPSSLWESPITHESGNSPEVIFENMKTLVSTNIKVKFYNILLNSFTTTVPIEMHASVVGILDDDLHNFFQVPQIKMNLTKKIKYTETFIQSLQQKKLILSSINKL